MTTTRHLLSSGSFTQDWSNTGLITANDDWSGVASIVGYLGDNSASSTAGVDPRTLISGAATAVDIVANQTNPNITNGGVVEFQITNPVVAMQGSGTADFPNLVIYLDSTGRENVTLAYTVRDIDASADNAVQQFVVQYRTSSTGDWINVDGTYLADASNGPSLTQDTPFSGIVLPAGANNAPELEVRFITTNAAGNDEWLGVDDIAISSSPTSGPASFLSVNDVTITEGNSGTTNAIFTVARSGTTTGTATVDFTVDHSTTDAADFSGALPSGTISFADGEVTKTITVAIAGDTATEPNETFFVNLTNAVGATLIDVQGTGTINNDDFSAVAINQIQGAGHASAFAGQTVVTNGIVTGVDTNGFYIQSETPDSDDATSEGLFVFTSSAPTVAVGDSVQVTGSVQESIPGGNPANFAITQLASPVITVLSSGNALPDAVIIGLGGRTAPNVVFEDDGFTSFNILTDAADFYESLEGMRVTVSNPLVTSDTNSFGETWVVASVGNGATGVNNNGGITISGSASGPDDYNPERIQIDDDTGLFAGFTPAYTQGDLLAFVTGIMSYNFQSYELLVTEAVSVVFNQTSIAEETTTLTGSANQVLIATYNVENLDPTDTKFALLGADIAVNLGAPDIISLNEIQDADGAGTGSDLSGQATANALIAAIQAAGGPAYQYVEVAPTVANSTGGEPGGNIRNGFLYNPLRVDYVANSATLITGSAFTNSRNPLSAQFEFAGQTITAVSVHSTSRGGSTALFGSTQPPVNGGEASRNAQATAIRSYVDGLLAADPNAYIAVMGDFNGFAFETAIETITAGGVMVDASALTPLEDRYSYVFEGNAQLLDHILLTANLYSGAVYDAVHINAEQPVASRPTDHDPQLVRVTILAAATGWTAGDDTNTNASTDNLINGLAGTDTLNMSTAVQSITVNLLDGTIVGSDVGNDIVSNIEVFELGRGIDTFIGNDGDSTIRGNDGDDSIQGNGGRDLMSGGAGTDLLYGGTGAANEMAGGIGDDVYYSDAAGDTMIELVGEGTDTVMTTRGSLVLAANIEDLTFTGTGAFVGIGNAVNNLITGGTAADFLAGGDGNDQLQGGLGAANTMLGGMGDDRYYVSAAGDSVLEAVGEGTDSVFATTSVFVLPDNVENLAFTGADPVVGVGNSGDNEITGTSASDTLFGNGGNDTLDGGTGGANTLFGGTGDDTYLVRSVGDSIYENSGEGTDLVETALSTFVLAAEVENLTFTDGTDHVGIGNAGANVIIGGAGSDFLAGLGGADTLTGGAGPDVFRFTEAGEGDVITDFVAGTDTIVFDAYTYATTETVEFETGTGAFGATSGNATLLYDTSSGLLRFDADGNGALAAFEIVTLTGAPALTMDGIFIY